MSDDDCEHAPVRLPGITICAACGDRLDDEQQEPTIAQLKATVEQLRTDWAVAGNQNKNLTRMLATANAEVERLTRELAHKSKLLNNAVVTKEQRERERDDASRSVQALASQLAEANKRAELWKNCAAKRLGAIISLSDEGSQYLAQLTALQAREEEVARKAFFEGFDVGQLAMDDGSELDARHYFEQSKTKAALAQPERKEGEPLALLRELHENCYGEEYECSDLFRRIEAMLTGRREGE